MRAVLVFILCISFTNPFFAQKNKNNAQDALIGVATLAAIIGSIEEIKEIYELMAFEYIMGNHPEFTQFELKAHLDNSKKWSDNSSSRLIPFSLKVMKNGTYTGERRILFMFEHTGPINEYGVPSRIREWEIYDDTSWNSLIYFFAQMASPIKIKETEDLIIPMYMLEKWNINSISEKLTKKPSAIFIKKDRQQPKNFHWYGIPKSNHHIKNLKYEKTKFMANNKTSKGINGIFPLFELKGDEYIVKDFNDKMKIFSNEKSMGLYFKRSNASFLLNIKILNNIHEFLNNIDDNFGDGFVPLTEKLKNK